MDETIKYYSADIMTRQWALNEMDLKPFLKGIFNGDHFACITYVL